MAVDRDDQVAADLDGEALEGLALVAALESRVVGRPAVDGARDQRTGVGPQVELVVQLRPDRLGGDAEVRVLDLAVLAELLERIADRVRRDREADAGV